MGRDLEAPGTEPKHMSVVWLLLVVVQVMYCSYVSVTNVSGNGSNLLTGILERWARERPVCWSPPRSAGRLKMNVDQSGEELVKLPQKTEGPKGDR